MKIEHEVEKIRIYTLGKKNIGFTIEVTMDTIVVINNVTKERRKYSIYKLINGSDSSE